MGKNNIASERTKLGFSQTELAEKLNVGLATIARWERGEISPPGNQLINMRNLFGCTTDYLLGLTNERT